MRCNVINFEMRTHSDNTYEDRFCHNKSDAKGTLDFLGERVSSWVLSLINDVLDMSRIHALPYHALASIPIVATSERLR